MKLPMNWQPTLSPEAIQFTTPEIMAKLLATIDSAEYPHLTMISSNIAISPTQIKWGKFVEGQSKEFVLKNPKQGVLYMTAAMPFRFLQAKMRFDSISKLGDDALVFNQMKLFRYNTYMRIDTVYFNNVIASRPIRDIPLPGIVKGIMGNLVFNKRKFALDPPQSPRLSKLGRKLFSGLIFPKFLSYLDPNDGYPVTFPVFQAREIDGTRIVIPFSQFKDDLLVIPEKSKVSLFAMDLETVSQMVKGTVIAKHSNAIVVEIEYVYNSMPPKPGYIYPELEVLPKVTQFT